MSNTYNPDPAANLELGYSNYNFPDYNFAGEGFTYDSFGNVVPVGSAAASSADPTGMAQAQLDALAAAAQSDPGLADLIKSLFGGQYGPLAFMGLAGLANQSSFFNPPAQKVGFQGVIPKYEYERQQTPMSVQRPEGYRPGQGGVTYFTPGQYYDVGYDPATAGEFLNTDTGRPSEPETTESQLARGGLAYADGGFTNEQIYNTYQGLLGQGLSHDQIIAAAERNPNLNLNAGQINAALNQFQPSNIPAAPMDMGATQNGMFGQIGKQAPGSSPGVMIIEDSEIPKVGSPAENLRAALDLAGAPLGQLPEGNTMSVGRGKTLYSAPETIDPFSNQYPGIAAVDTARAAPPPPQESGIAALPSVTDQQIFNAGKSLLQQGVDPQTILNKLASQTGATQSQINQAANWLSSSGFAGLTIPGSKSTTMPVTEKATADAGIAALPGAAAVTATTPSASLGALQSEIFGAFNQAQQTGNWSDFARKAQEMNLGADEIAALFPNLTAAGVSEFAKAKGIQLGTNQPFTRQNIEQAIAGDEPGKMFAEKLIAASGLTLTPEQKAKMMSDMGAATPIALRPFLEEAFRAAASKNDYSKLSNIISKYNLSKSDVKSLYQGVSNQGIAELEKRGVKFDQTPDWIQGLAPDIDKNAATQIIDKWRSVYGRDATPQEVTNLYNQTRGQNPVSLQKVLSDIKIVPLDESEEYKGYGGVNTMTLQKAGLLDLVRPGFDSAYNWDEIIKAGKKTGDYRGALIAANREIAKFSNNELLNIADNAKKVGEVAGIPVIVRSSKGRNATQWIEFAGQPIDTYHGLLEHIYKFGLNSDDIKKLADIADKSGIDYKVDLRDIAAGGYGTRTAPNDYDLIKQSGLSGADPYSLQNKAVYYADRLGLGLNRNVTSAIGSNFVDESELYPMKDKDGKLLNYAVRSGGGFRYYSSPEEAKAAGATGDIVNLTGRKPPEKPKSQYRPGDKVNAPTSLPKVDASLLMNKYERDREGKGGMFVPGRTGAGAPTATQTTTTTTTPAPKSTLPSGPTVKPTSVAPATTSPPPRATQSGGISTIPTQYTQALMAALARAAAARRTTPTTASRTTAKQAGIGSLTPTTVLRRKPVGGAAGGDVTMLAKGRYLKGNGDGVSDSIPAKFAGSGQPAALADGEFVIPARVVSELGNGSSDAGARKLYAMLDRVEQRARKAKRGKPSGADRELKKLA